MTAAYLAMDRCDIQHSDEERDGQTKALSALLEWSTPSGAENQEAIGA